MVGLDLSLLHDAPEKFQWDGGPKAEDGVQQRLGGPKTKMGFIISTRKKIPETCTHLKFNIAPENWWLEYYFPIRKVTFQGLC